MDTNHTLDQGSLVLFNDGQVDHIAAYFRWRKAKSGLGHIYLMRQEASRGDADLSPTDNKCGVL